MSFIGSLDQFDLSIILQRIESYQKTGLLEVKQGERSVELSFRQGQLLCIGPLRLDISLADRLLQAGVISRQAYQEVALTPGIDLYREVGAALTLIDLGHVNQQSLYSWALREATRVIEALISWTDGEIYFEENQAPPSDRLLIALPISSMLPVQPAEVPAQPVAVGASQPASSSSAQSTVSTTSVLQGSISNTPTIHGEEPTFFDNTIAMTSFPVSHHVSPGRVPDTERHTDALVRSTIGTLLPPQPITTPTPPTRVNTAYMQPHMVITPVDLSAFREQNPQIPFTPEQWRLFTRADGQTTLQMAMQELSMSRDTVCQVAGELVALGVITLSLPTHAAGDVNELSPISREYIQAGLSNGLVTPGYAVTPGQPWDAAQPAPNPHSRFSLPYPIETQSQWGNGGNGATFVLGNGWVVSPATGGQPPNPLPMTYRDETNHIYAKAG